MEVGGGWGICGHGVLPDVHCRRQQRYDGKCWGRFHAWVATVLLGPYRLANDPLPLECYRTLASVQDTNRSEASIMTVQKPVKEIASEIEIGIHCDLEFYWMLRKMEIIFNFKPLYCFWSVVQAFTAQYLQKQ